LDNPYHKNNQNRKGLYNDLERIKGQDNLLPAVKVYLERHKKNGIGLGSGINGKNGKSNQYQISKLI